MTDPERFALLQLWLAEGVGPERLRKLLERFGNAEGVLRASRSDLESTPLIGAKVAAAILDPARLDRAREEATRMNALGVQWMTHADEDYPPLLKEIPRSPFALTVRGILSQPAEVGVAVVGSRSCSQYGKDMAAQLARDLALRGVVVVSGLARGVDGVAHQAAIDAGGRTLAVLASGLANIYPPEHRELAERVVNQGALISEAPLDGAPVGNLFPLRNRIISGLCRAVVVVEAAAKSGALSTAYHALDQNREVYAVPGRVGDPTSAGTIELMRKGATPIRNADDVLEQLGPLAGLIAPAPRVAAAPMVAAPPAPPPPAAPPPSLSDSERKIWDALAGEAVDLDSLAERIAMNVREVSSTLLMLEMRGVVARKPGARFARR